MRYTPQVRISPATSCGSGNPACKVNVNDSHHSYFGMWNDTAQQNRNCAWQNFMNCNQVLFMDPYVVYHLCERRNLCVSPSNAICRGPDTQTQPSRTREVFAESGSALSTPSMGVSRFNHGSGSVRGPRRKSVLSFVQLPRLGATNRDHSPVLRIPHFTTLARLM
jgi:hypothetical protein